MKKGESITLPIRIGVDMAMVSTVVFTMKTENNEAAPVFKTWRFDPPYTGDRFALELDPQDTIAPIKQLFLEASVTFCNGKIGKSLCRQLPLSPSLQLL